MKRRAIIKTLATIAAALTGKYAVAQEEKASASYPTLTGTTDGLYVASSTSLIPPVMSVSLALEDADARQGGISSINITYHGETVTLTAKEIFEALRP